MRKSVSKLKKKEFVYECTLRNVCISGVQTILPAELKLYLGWLDFLTSTRVLHMNILINDEYSRMLHILLNLQYTNFHMFKFLLGPQVWRIKTKQRYFSTVPKIIPACFIPPRDQKYCFLPCNNDSFLFLLILLYIYVFLNLSKNRFFVYFLSTVADGE